MAVPAVTTIGNTTPMTWVPLTRTSPTLKFHFDVGSVIEWALRPQTDCIVPNKISSKPNVAVAFTSGSRGANGGPRNTP